MLICSPLFLQTTSVSNFSGLEVEQPYGQFSSFFSTDLQSYQSLQFKFARSQFIYLVQSAGKLYLAPMSNFRVLEMMKNYRLVSFSLLQPGMNSFRLTMPPSLTSSRMIDSARTDQFPFGLLLFCYLAVDFRICLSTGTIFLMTVTLFLWLLIALAYPFIMQTLMLSLWHGDCSIFWHSSTNLGSSRMWQILVQLISLMLLRLDSSICSSSSLGELRIKLTGTMKGSRSLKQYVSSRYRIVYTGVEYLTLGPFSAAWNEPPKVMPQLLRLLLVLIYLLWLALKSSIGQQSFLLVSVEPLRTGLILKKLTYLCSSSQFLALTGSQSTGGNSGSKTISNISFIICGSSYLMNLFGMPRQGLLLTSSSQVRRSSSIRKSKPNNSNYFFLEPRRKNFLTLRTQSSTKLFILYITLLVSSCASGFPISSNIDFRFSKGMVLPYSYLEYSEKCFCWQLLVR